TTAPNVTNNQSNIAGTSTVQASNVTVATNATAASNLLQGSTGNILYVAKMNVTTQPVTVSSVDIPISGTMNASDIGAMYVYFNPTVPTLTGATLLNGIVPGIAAPHTFTITFSQPMAIGSSGYFIITGNVSNTAVDGHTIIINGATAPLVFGFTTAPNVTNNQSNIAGTSTIQASNVTVATNTVPAAVIKPGSSGNIIYVAKMIVTTQPVTVNSADIPLTGTVNATDIAAMYVYFNATSPNLTGATLLNGIVPTFAAPHTYTINFTQALISGGSGYFIFTVNVSTSATIGNTVKVNGATGPVVFGFTTAPNVTNNQSDLGGLQTLPISLTSFTVKLIENTALLNWTTTSEVNNASFDIERSTDGINFTWIGNIKANPGVSGYHNYGFIDQSPETGTNFYRLRQIDFDSHSKYSSVIKIALDINRMSIGTLYPNPVRNILTYAIYSPVRGQMLMRLSDVSGKVFINQKIILAKGKNEQILNVSQLAGGQYQLTFIDPATNTIFSKAVTILR
ncbi:MAG: T9SS type A sorting domain-containing protein, partial [Ginsengibacter sp.]